MKYKVGDRVKAKSLDWYNENKNKFGKVWTSGKGTQIPFDKHMSKWCGKVMTISDVRADHYTMIEDLVGYWTDEMIEGLVEEETKFNSQICTSIEQSKALLALGLKKETADMYWFRYDVDEYKLCTNSWIEVQSDEEYFTHYKSFCIPAWSLHRLIEMMPISIRKDGFHNSLVYDFHRDWCVYMLYANGEQMPYNKILEGFQNCNLYDNIIDCIEWLIKEGYFNKEYLV